MTYWETFNVAHGRICTHSIFRRLVFVFFFFLIILWTQTQFNYIYIFIRVKMDIITDEYMHNKWSWNSTDQISYFRECHWFIFIFTHMLAVKWIINVSVQVIIWFIYSVRQIWLELRINYGHWHTPIYKWTEMFGRPDAMTSLLLLHGYILRSQFDVNAIYIYIRKPFCQNC